MAKNIVICSDGTGNTAIKGRGTNVFKLFESLDLTTHRVDPSVKVQLAFYDDGVGTQEFKPLKIFAGMTGWGLSRNVKSLYKQLVRVYDPGDDIYLFGFSRGAFTVRTLAGFICRIGLLEAARFASAEDLDQAVERAYSAYRDYYESWLSRAFDPLVRGLRRSPIPESDFHKDVRIRFIGVWDTVDAVGLPFRFSDVINTTIYRFKFPDNELSQKVDCAYQALSVDDDRSSFTPLLWTDAERIHQVWFAGAHSNVGGGYPKQGMSLVALKWMISAAAKEGLRFNSVDRQFYAQHPNVDDKRYEPRSGLGVFYRWKIRDVDALCRNDGVAPKLHLSVLERIAHGTEGYSPGNLPIGSKIVIDEGNPSPLLRFRAALAQNALHQAQTGKRLLNRVTTAIRIGVFSYYLFLATCLGAPIAMAAPGELSPDSGFWKNLFLLLWGLITSPFQTLTRVAWPIQQHILLWTVSAAGLGISMLLGKWSDRRISRVFSVFWHSAQPQLRQALKSARTQPEPPIEPESSRGTAAGANRE